MWYLVLTVIVIYFYGTRTFNYWKNRGVKNDPPLPLLGNNWRQFFQKASMAMLATEAYNKYPEEKVVGFYRGTNPELVIRDPEIAKRILTIDFQHFYARGARLGQMQSMAGLAAILQKFTVVPAAHTLRNPKPEPTAIVSESFVGGLPLTIKKRF